MDTDSDMTSKIAFIITGLNIGGAEMMLLKMLERQNVRFSRFVASFLSGMSYIGTLLVSFWATLDFIDMPLRFGIDHFSQSHE